MYHSIAVHFAHMHDTPVSLRTSAWGAQHRNGAKCSVQGAGSTGLTTSNFRNEEAVYAVMRPCSQPTTSQWLVLQVLIRMSNYWGVYRFALAVQVRMVDKGVLKAILPWEDARRVLAMRLRRRLAEDAVRAHVASADPTVQRSDALQLIESWYTGMAADDFSSQGTVGNGPSSHGSAATLPDVGGCAEAQVCTHHELVARDQQFLEWLNSAQGAAKIGAELKKLKRNAAAATVLEVAKSQEGREGLLLALKGLLETNLSLKAQLASMIGS